MSLREFFNQAAAGWRMEPEVIDRLRGIVDRCDLKEGDCVLDVACGTGVLVPILLEAVGPGGEVIGIDFAPEMIRHARAKNYGPNARFQVADVMALPFADESFDQVFCNGALPHFSNIPGALQEMRRVLRTGGRLVICHASSRAEINERHRRIGGPVADNLLPPATDLKDMLKGAGFKGIIFEDSADRFVFSAYKSV